MTNQTLIQVPLDLENEDVMRRFFQKVTEELDFITGNRAQDPYVASSDVEAVSLTSVNEAITTANENTTTIENRVEDNETDIEAIQAIIDDVQYMVTHFSLDSTYNDFDDNAWGALKGRGQFSALGSAMTNAPFAVTAGTTYIVYTDSTLTLGGGVAQRVMMEDTGVDLKVFYRTGDTFTLAKSNGWTQL